MHKKLLKITCVAAASVAAFSGVFFTGCGEDASFKWALKTIKKYYYEDLPQGCVYEGDIKQFVSTYCDKYSAYYTRDEYAAVTASNAGNKSGVGVAVSYAPASVHPSGISGIAIERVVGNSPAYFAGVKVGEIITGATYNGSRISFNSTSQFDEFIGGKNSGESFTLLCDKHEGGHTLAKSEYVASYCRMATSEAGIDVTYDGKNLNLVESSSGAISFLPQGAAYMRLDQFYGQASKEMASLIGRFNAIGCTSLILDLRGNGGGYVDVMQEISDIFVGERTGAYKSAMYSVGKSGRESFAVKDCFRSSQSLSPNVKVSVLADNSTASASEALIGVLISNGVISYKDVYLSDFTQSYLNLKKTDKNCTTYGKGIMQSTYVRGYTGEAIKLTTAKIYWPDGTTCIHGTGINAAAGCSTVKASWSFTYDDEQLSSAITQIYG